jgi:hypothetical protein
MALLAFSLIFSTAVLYVSLAFTALAIRSTLVKLIAQLVIMPRPWINAFAMKVSSRKMDNVDHVMQATIARPRPQRYFARGIAWGLPISQLLALAPRIEFVLNVLLQPLQLQSQVPQPHAFVAQISIIMVVAAVLLVQ